jgi:putative phosphoribosyl transferase
VALGRYGDELPWAELYRGVAGVELDATPQAEQGRIAGTLVLAHDPAHGERRECLPEPGTGPAVDGDRAASTLGGHCLRKALVGQVVDRRNIHQSMMARERFSRRPPGYRVANPQDDGSMSEQVELQLSGVDLAGDLAVPRSATGMVIFAHGSDSSRLSPRNQYVARILNEAGFATLLFDLLSTKEAADRRNVFDIPLLAERLTAAHAWAAKRQDLAIGYFGASTGGAAALWSAAGGTDGAAAVVSRGGRVDLAGERLGSVEAPTLLIVGERDTEVLELNRQVMRQLRCVSRLDVVPAATHLFSEPGTLEQVAVLARDWFRTHLHR